MHSSDSSSQRERLPCPSACLLSASEALLYSPTLGVPAAWACNLASAVADVEVDFDFSECLTEMNGKAPKMDTILFQPFRLMSNESISGHSVGFEDLQEAYRGPRIIKSKRPLKPRDIRHCQRGKDPVEAAYKARLEEMVAERIEQQNR